MLGCFDYRSVQQFIMYSFEKGMTKKWIVEQLLTLPKYQGRGRHYTRKYVETVRRRMRIMREEMFLRSKPWKWGDPMDSPLR
jgi:hypothetical protein